MGVRDIVTTKLGHSGIDVLEDRWITKVAAQPNNTVRAHSIALTYHRLALRLDEIITGDKAHATCLARVRPTMDVKALEPEQEARVPDGLPVPNANWFHFATWATLTVTQNIGNERGPQRLNSGIGAPLRRRLTPAIARAKATDEQRLGRALAWGQRLVFIAVTNVMRAFDDEHRGVSAEVTQEQLHKDVYELIKGLVGPDPQHWLDEQRHIQPLWRAFDWYRLAKEEAERYETLQDEWGKAESKVKRAWLIFGANLLMTEVEQDLLDPAFGVVIDHIPEHISSSVSWRLARLSERLRNVPSHLAYNVAQSRNPGPRRALDTMWSRLMTDQVLVMALPAETLRLGRDIPPRYRQWPYLPPHLRHEPPRPVAPAPTPTDVALREIVLRLHAVDRTTGNGHGSAARDIRRWDERLNWSATLLRTRQQDGTLWWAPYDALDVELIARQRPPEHCGDPTALEVQAPVNGGTTLQSTWLRMIRGEVQ